LLAATIASSFPSSTTDGVVDWVQSVASSLSKVIAVALLPPRSTFDDDPALTMLPLPTTVTTQFAPDVTVW